MTDMSVYYDPWLAACGWVATQIGSDDRSQDERDNYCGLTEEEIELMEWRGE